MFLTLYQSQREEPRYPQSNAKEHLSSLTCVRTEFNSSFEIKVGIFLTAEFILPSIKDHKVGSLLFEVEVHL